MRKAAFLAVLGSLALALVVGAAGDKKNGPPNKAKSNQAVEQLIDQLGHRKYRTRQAAQKALAKVGIDALPLLLKARKTRTDLEVIRRLDHVIPSMERVAMLMPRTVTLHLDNKSVREVLDEITRQTGYQLDLQNFNPNNQTYKFNFDKVPFWQAVDKVCDKTGLSVYQYSYYGGSNDRIQLTSYGTKPGPFVQYAETFRLVPTGMHYSRSVNYGGDRKQPAHSRSEYMNLQFMIFTEPKLPFIQVFSPIITEAYDENKKPMFIKTAVADPFQNPGYYYGNSRFLSNSQSVNLIRPSRDSKVAKVIRGEIPVMVLSKEQELLVVNKPLEVKKKKFKGPSAEMEVEEVAQANNWGNNKAYTVKLNLKEDSDNPNMDYNWQYSLQHRLALVDAKGNKYLHSGTSLHNPGGRGGRFVQGSVTFYAPNNGVAIGDPVKLIYYKWITEQHRIKFEFKDLPLP
jgi:hypothetical protein